MTSPFWLSPFEQEALLLSLKVSTWAVGLSLPLGIFLAWLLVYRNFWGKALVESLLQLPLVLPPVVIGYGLLLLLGRQGPLGALLYRYFGVSLVFDWKGAVLASALVGLPLMVSAIRLSIAAVDPLLIEASLTLGKGPWETFFRVTLPLSLPGVVTGTLLAFARSLGEFGATITFVSNIPGLTQTLPLALYTQTQLPGGDVAAGRLCVLSILLALSALAGSRYLSKKWDFQRVSGD